MTEPVAPLLTEAELRVVLVPCVAKVWPLEKLLLVCREWQAGTKPTAISRLVGCTKNAAVGKIHRLTERGILQARVSEAPPPRVARAGRSTLPSFAAEPSGEAPSPPPPPAGRSTSPTPTSLAAPATVTYVAPYLGRVVECCWPIGRPAKPGFRYCGAPSVPRRPYCAEHEEVAREKPRGHAAPMAGTGAELSGDNR